MLALSAKIFLRQKADAKRRERQPLGSFSRIFKTDGAAAEQVPGSNVARAAAWRSFFMSMRPARNWSMPVSDRTNSDALSPPSGARLTLTVLHE
jgi:hypothetical protein